MVLSNAAWLGVLVLASVGAKAEFYTAYSKYPDYCSTPSMMETRKIPPLQKESMGETRLVHVTAVLRHGARTPANGGFPCWQDYWENEETGVWNCSLTIDMAPPTPKREQEEENSSSPTEEASDVVTLFEKKYDALMKVGPEQHNKKDDLSNDLYGTCQTGQLLLQGYDQHVVNGQILREAYAFDSANKYDHDIRMRLLDTTAQDHKPWDEPQVYLRADDEERTLLSGQILLRSLFESEIETEAKKNNAPVRIPVHTADYHRDYLSINEDICPRLHELRTNFEASSAYRSFNHSKEAKHLRKFMNDKLGSSVEIDILGCLMPTVCADRPLPDAFDYEGKSDIFDRMVNFAYERWNMHLLANKGEYAKLATGALWAEIMSSINPIIQDREPIPPEKLAIISGHDDTISPLMASLGIWDKSQWPAYASMFIIELHEIIDAAETDRSVFQSNFAFRLILNGEVMTSNIEGCQDDNELCDMQILSELISGFATRDRNCQPTKSTLSVLLGSDKGLSGPVKCFLMILLGAALGGAGVFYYLTGSIPRPSCQNRNRSGFESRESGMSIPPTSYSDEPESYQDGPDKNPTSYLS